MQIILRKAIHGQRRSATARPMVYRCCMTVKKVIWAILAVSAGFVVGLLLRSHRLQVISVRRLVPIEGAVIQRDVDTQNELPIADVVITASDGAASATTSSDAAGHYKLVLQRGVLSGEPVEVTLQHPDYEPLGFEVQTGRLMIPDKLYVAAMIPVPLRTPA